MKYEMLVERRFKGGSKQEKLELNCSEKKITMTIVNGISRTAAETLGQMVIIESQHFTDASSRSWAGRREGLN
jgi:hypothetical protein